MSSTEDTGTRAGAETPRTWCGAPLPPEVVTLPHPTALRFGLPLSRFHRWFGYVWCGMTFTMTLFVAVLAFPVGLVVTAPLGLFAAFIWTRPARTTVTFRPRSRWVVGAIPTSFSLRRVDPNSVDLVARHERGGCVARLRLGGSLVLAETPVCATRAEAAARLLPLANALRREMGGTPIPAHWFEGDGATR